ncbi:bric a brac 1 isoform 2-T2 [Cochliomyia hominivorax]
MDGWMNSCCYFCSRCFPTRDDNLNIYNKNTTTNQNLPITLFSIVNNWKKNKITMDSNSPLSRAESSHEQSGSKEYTSPLRETTEAKSGSPRPPSRPSSVLPNILATFGTSPSVSSHTKKNTPEHRQDDVLEGKSSPMAHSDTCPSTPICGIPPYSPQSDRSSCGSTSATAPQQFCLRWNNYQSNLTSVFDQLLQNESFVDVTLACDGRSIKAHKMVLSACSPYFQTLFSTTPCQHPIVIMRDVNWFELKSIVDFMYKGEINVSQEQIGPLLRIAEMLKVRGLADVSNLSNTANTAQLSTVQTSSSEKDLYSSQNIMESPKQTENVQSPTTKRPQSQTLEMDHERCEQVKDISSLNEPEKKSRLEVSEWDISGSVKTTESSNLELRLSPLQHQHLLGRNIRKRRWPSADAIFNPPESPLSSLIAAERAEQERERERAREREREKAREISLFTPPIPVTSCSSGATSSLNTSALEPTVHMDITSPSPTPTPNLLPPSRTPSGMLTPSPHLQITHHHSHQTHQSHRSSPASSVTSTHPSSILSRPLTPSPASISHTGPGGRLEGNQMSGDSSHRFPMGPAQAAAMAAAAAQMDLGAGSSMSMRPHSSSGPPMSTGSGHHTSSLVDDLEIKPGIAEMIREEERAKMLENSHAWMGASGSSIADSYQYQLQSMWQKCWNTNQSLMHHLRFRERGPLKSWRPETMAEAIFSVLKEGLSLSQAARKYDIPYPTFVLYANRVHNMLGPSIDGGPDLRPKGRGRPQRILLGIWPDEHIKGVIKTVVFRDAKDLKEEGLAHLPYGRHSPVFPFQEGPLSYPGVGGPCPNGMPGAAGDQMSQEATAAAVAAVAHNIRQQMQMAAAAQQQQQIGESHGGSNLFNLPPHMASGGPMSGPPGAGGVPLPKASISPALSSSSNTAGLSSMMGPRHVPSPCGPNLPGMPQLPPSMAVALHMAGGPGGRCDPSAVLSQQQQHQFQHLHLQQQHALHQQQKHQQQQQHQMAFGPHTSSLSHSSMAGAPSHTMIHQTMQKSASASSTKPLSSTSSPSRRNSPHSLTPLHSPLTELGLEMSFKPSRPFSPSRLFSDDISDIVGVAASPLRSPSTSHPSTATAVTTATITTTSSINPATVRSSSSEPSVSAIATSATTATSTASAAIDSTASTTSNISSTGIKLEPITTSSD